MLRMVPLPIWRWGRRVPPTEAAHPLEMLLGELEMAAGGMDVGAAAGQVELGEGAAGMVADLVVHASPLMQVRTAVLDLDQTALNY